MEFILGIVSLVEFFYILYQDIINRRERERLQLKLMSKDVAEYKGAVDGPPENAKDERDPYVPVEDVPIEKLLGAEDNL